MLKLVGAIRNLWACSGSVGLCIACPTPTGLAVSLYIRPHRGSKLKRTILLCVSLKSIIGLTKRGYALTYNTFVGVPGVQLKLQASRLLSSHFCCAKLDARASGPRYFV